MVAIATGTASMVTPALQPKPPPTERRDDPDLAFGFMQGFGEQIALGEWALGGGPQGDVALVILLGDGDMRFDRHMLNLRDVEGIFHDRRTLFEGFLGIPFANLEMIGDIGAIDSGK